MVVQMLFSKRQVFDRTGKLTGAKFNEFVDPDPTHALGTPAGLYPDLKRRNVPIRQTSVAANLQMLSMMPSLMSKKPYG